MTVALRVAASLSSSMSLSSIERTAGQLWALLGLVLLSALYILCCCFLLRPMCFLLPGFVVDTLIRTYYTTVYSGYLQLACNALHYFLNALP